MPIVVAQLTVGKDEPAEARDRPGERLKPAGAVALVSVNEFPGVAAGRDVVDRARVVEPQRSGHASRLGSRGSSCPNRTLSPQVWECKT